ncbi:hypothetical protein N752_17940 [Desulforamulus aquiferis]|nr:hypothetical protein [Desulforamulus aquiferis]RYD03964.1 hypothetical protein N752_17940 [Desulforamulus aquiferis]
MEVKELKESGGTTSVINETYPGQLEDAEADSSLNSLFKLPREKFFDSLAPAV